MDKINSQRGFSTIEMMMALAIISIVLSAVVVTSFTNQMTLTSSQTNSEAMNIAQKILEQEQALARKDFQLVVATSTFDGFYTGTVTVTNPPTGVPAHPYDYFSKIVKAIVSWKDERGMARNTTLTTLVSNFGNTAGGNSCNTAPQGSWNPPAQHSYTVAGLSGLSASNITGLDAYLDKLYVTVGNKVSSTDRSLFVFNLSGGVPSFANATNTTSTSFRGANAVVVAATTTAPNGHVYAYVANAVGPDWSSTVSCNTPSDTCSQLQVLDLGTVSVPAAPTVVARYKFATSSKSVSNVPPYLPNSGTPPYIIGTGGQGSGQALFYKNGYVFLGLTKTSSGPEFHIFDVHNPLSPQDIGSFPIGRTVKSIAISGNFAYLATDDNGAGGLTVLDISNPTAISAKWTVPSLAGIGFGRGLAAVGDTLHVVKTADSGAGKAEWYVLSNATPSSAAPVVSGAADFGGSVSLNNILVRDYLAFITTTTAPFQLMIRNATSTAQYSAPIALPAAGTALDCEGNFVYAGSADAAGTITVIGQ